MGTVIAIAIMVIVGLIAVRIVYRMIKGKDDYSTCGCGCPACTTESCPTRDAPADDTADTGSSDASAAARKKSATDRD